MCSCCWIIIDYTMAKVVSSHISARPSCILQRVMGLVTPEDRRSSGDTRPMTRGRIQLGRADVRDDTTSAMVLSFYLIPTFSVKVGLDYCSLEDNLP